MIFTAIMPILVFKMEKFMMFLSICLCAGVVIGCILCSVESVEDKCEKIRDFMLEILYRLGLYRWSPKWERKVGIKS